MTTLFKVITVSGHHWVTDINGDITKAREYFIGKQFNVGVFPHEKMEEVKTVIALSVAV